MAFQNLSTKNEIMKRKIIGSQSVIIITTRLLDDGFNMLDDYYDALLVSSPSGYSPLGLLRMELEKTGNSNLIRTLDKKCNHISASDDFIIGCFNLNKKMKIMLAPNQNAKFYETNTPTNNLWLDFGFASTYCSLVLASKLAIKKLALSHSLHGINNDFIKTIGNAISAYANQFAENTLEEIVMVGCCFNHSNLTNLFDEQFNLINQTPQFDFETKMNNSFPCMKINLLK